jgi:4-phosphopantoate--beta-alanine ligase
MGIVEIVVDLNPMSRSAQSAAVPIVDNIVRAVPNVTAHARDLSDASREELERIVETFDREAALREAEAAIRGGELA